MASNIPEKMTACQVVEYKKPYEIQEVPVPKDLGPHDLLVKVAVGSLCHTDSMVADGAFRTKLPCTASHEGAGTVALTGSLVKSFKPGDRVMVGLMVHPCGHCADCLGPEEYRQYCSNHDGHVGVTRDGAFAEYLLCDSRVTAKLPDSVSFETAAPLACAGCTVWRGVLQSRLKAGEWLALVGSGGGLGHLGIQFARALGIKVIGIDARDEGLELSWAAGADVVVDARRGKDAVVREVHRVTDGKGADATVVISDAKTATATGCAVTRVHGTLVQIAQPPDVVIPFHELIFRDIRVKGSLICSPAEARSMLDLVAEHGITVKTNAFHGLAEIPKLIELAHSGKMAGKGIVIVDPKQIEQEKKAVAKLV